MGRPTSDAQRKAVLAYQKRQDSIVLRPPKDDGAQIRAAAAAAGINVEFSGNTSSPDLKSYSQSIAAGQTVAQGKVVTVNFREEAQADIAN